MALDSKKILDEFEDLEKRYKEIKTAYDGDCILNELEEYKKLNKTSIEKMWLTDLDNFEAEYDKYCIARKDR